MKYVLVLVVLALGASAVSAASVFLREETARMVVSSGGGSIGALVVAALGMVATIAWRCHSEGREL